MLKAVDYFVRMRKITRSVKVALKCLIAVVLDDVDLPYGTSNVEHLVAFPATVSSSNRTVLPHFALSDPSGSPRTRL